MADVPHVELTRPAAFLLVKTRAHAARLASTIGRLEGSRWAAAAFGPYQVVAYVEADTVEDLVAVTESLRQDDDIRELDARICKAIPGDEEMEPPVISGAETAVLLINVDYKVEKERVVTYNLRALDGVKLARAMWGPADIIAVVEAEDRESMRNLICDEVKMMKGVLSNTTLYCYP